MAARRAKPARRRAKQARARATTDAILEAAARILVREGYAGATTNRIAEVAGVSVGTLYQYFADKNDLFDALIRREMRALAQVLEAEGGRNAESLESMLHRIFRGLTAAQPFGPELYRQLEYVPNALLRRRVRERNGHVIAFMRQLLEAHRAELGVDDVDLAAFLLVYATQGIAFGASPALFGERLAAELTALFTRYLRGGQSAV
jgi:AcrR family transcriptional regulator